MERGLFAWAAFPFWSPQGNNLLVPSGFLPNNAVEKDWKTRGEFVDGSGWI